MVAVDGYRAVVAEQWPRSSGRGAREPSKLGDQHAAYGVWFGREETMDGDWSPVNSTRPVAATVEFGEDDGDADLSSESMLQ